jgi:CheY-like chemotaxis protein/HPt (histidine-containing phosphotransfer) domain-containing protein
VKHYLLKPARQSDLYKAIAEALGGGATASRTQVPADGPIQADGNDDAPLVLVAEDNEVNQLLATATLEQRGLRPEVARTGLEAVRMATTRQYAAIFMDCQMPEIDGYEATRRIRVAETTHHAPIIAMTANAMPSDRDRCLAAGMNDYLAKPVQPWQLDRTLARWLPTVGDHDHDHDHDRDHDHEPKPEPDSGEATSSPVAELLDAGVVARIRADFDSSMRDRLMSTFETSLQRCVTRIEDAARDGDGGELRRVAHLLKGSSATVGAARLRETCAELERLAVSDQVMISAWPVDELASIAETTASALRDELLAA